MSETSESTTGTKHFSATELRKLPLKERNRILGEQAALAVEIYRAHPELTDIAAFGSDDLYVESSNTEYVEDSVPETL